MGSHIHSLCYLMCAHMPLCFYSDVSSQRLMFKTEHGKFVGKWSFVRIPVLKKKITSTVSVTSVRLPQRNSSNAVTYKQAPSITFSHYKQVDRINTFLYCRAMAKLAHNMLPIAAILPARTFWVRNNTWITVTLFALLNIFVPFLIPSKSLKACASQETQSLQG